MNINFKRLLYSPVGKIFISIILGLGLATLFRKACNNRSCLVFHAPPLDKIKEQVFQYGEKCYTFSPKAESCELTKEKVEFA